jgi:hypothetical protein
MSLAAPFLITSNASIEETQERNGTFRATLHETPLEIVSRDPEHDLCHAMVEAGLADGPIQFWRRETPSLIYRSVHRTASKRVELGEKFPCKRVPRRNLSETERASIAGGQIKAGGYEAAWEGPAHG